MTGNASDPSDNANSVEDTPKGRSAIDEILPSVYSDLKRIAGEYLNRERADHTLQPTAVVHETYLRLVNQHSPGWADRGQFFAVAAKIMRRVLVDHARAKRAAKRGGGRTRFEFDELFTGFEKRAVDLIELDDCLDALAKLDPTKSRIVELRFFGGLSVNEVADVLRIPTRTVERHWTFSKAWLRTKLQNIS